MYLVTCYFGFAGSNDLDEAIHANRVYFELILMLKSLMNYSPGEQVFLDMLIDVS